MSGIPLSVFFLSLTDRVSPRHTKGLSSTGMEVGIFDVSQFTQRRPWGLEPFSSRSLNHHSAHHVHKTS